MLFPVITYTAMPFQWMTLLQVSGAQHALSLVLVFIVLVPQFTDSNICIIDMLASGALNNISFIFCEMRSKRSFEVYRTEIFYHFCPLQIVTDGPSAHHRPRGTSVTGIKHYER